MTADVRATVGKRKLQQKLPGLLQPGESISAIAVGAQADNWRQELKTKNHRLIVATDRRLLLIPLLWMTADGIAAEAMHGEPESLDFDRVDGLQETIGRMESKLEIVAASRCIRITSMRAKPASAVAAAIRHGRAGAGQAAPRAS